MARKLHKNEKTITIQIFDEATSVKITYKQSSGTGIPSHVPTQPRDRFGCKSILRCSCPGKERKFQPVRICIRTVILKGWGLVLLLPPACYLHPIFGISNIWRPIKGAKIQSFTAYNLKFNPNQFIVHLKFWYLSIDQILFKTNVGITNPVLPNL